MVFIRLRANHKQTIEPKVSFLKLNSIKYILRTLTQMVSNLSISSWFHEIDVINSRIQDKLSYFSSIFVFLSILLHFLKPPWLISLLFLQFPSIIFKPPWLLSFSSRILVSLHSFSLTVLFSLFLDILRTQKIKSTTKRHIQKYK